MVFLGLGDAFWLNWVVVPFLIFVARIIDVTLGTVKIIFISKGIKRVSSVLAFFEVMVWLLAISKIFENLNNPMNFLAYASGFAAGTYVGMSIEERIAVGTNIVEVITRRNPDGFVEFLKKQGYAVTRMRGEGYEGPVHIIYSIVNRKKLPQILYIIEKFNPNAFYTVKDIEHVSEKVGPLEPSMQEKLQKSINGYKTRSFDGVKKTGGKIMSTKPYLTGKIDQSLRKFRTKK